MHLVHSKLSRRKQMQEYVRARLRAEREAMGRGGTVDLAKALGCSNEHVSNMLHERPTRNPGEDLMRAAADRWGMSYAELEAVACGHATSSPAPGSRADEDLRSVVREEIARVIGTPKTHEK